jgi:hypothetical protein
MGKRTVVHGGSEVRHSRHTQLDEDSNLTSHEANLKMRCEYARAKFLREHPKIPFHAENHEGVTIAKAHIPRKTVEPQTVQIGYGVVNLAPQVPTFGKRKQPRDTIDGSLVGGLVIPSLKQASDDQRRAQQTVVESPRHPLHPAMARSSMWEDVSLWHAPKAPPKALPPLGESASARGLRATGTESSTEPQTSRVSLAPLPATHGRWNAAVWGHGGGGYPRGSLVAAE